MSFRQMLDHRADIVRPSPPLSADSLGDERDVYTTVYANVRCALWAVHAPIDDYGAGETPTGDTGITFEKSVIPRDRDIVILLMGPEAPKQWRIKANRSPGRRSGRRAHHREVITEAFESPEIFAGEPVETAAFTTGFSLGFEA